MLAPGSWQQGMKDNDDVNDEGWQKGEGNPGQHIHYLSISVRTWGAQWNIPEVISAHSHLCQKKITSLTHYVITSDESVYKRDLSPNYQTLIRPFKVPSVQVNILASSLLPQAILSNYWSFAHLSKDLKFNLMRCLHTFFQPIAQCLKVLVYLWTYIWTVVDAENQSRIIMSSCRVFFFFMLVFSYVFECIHYRMIELVLECQCNL